MRTIYLTDNQSVEHLKGEPIIEHLKQPIQVIYPDGRMATTPLIRRRLDGWATGNYVGSYQYGTTQLIIQSRFSSVGQPDLFFRYLLHKIYQIPITKQTSGTQFNETPVFLQNFLFPTYLLSALNQGVYKEYHKRMIHASVVKGPINVTQQVKRHTPFVGQFASKERYFDYNNPMMQLVRHTIEYLSDTMPELLTSLPVRQAVHTVREVTPTYRPQQRQQIITYNRQHPIPRHFYQAYRPLQRLCLSVLQQQPLQDDTEDQWRQSFIFNIASFWEKYIGRITGWDQETLSVYQNNNQLVRYPDFIYNGYPIDTKYKLKIDPRQDTHQMITYMFLMQATKGFFILPNRTVQKKVHHGSLSGYGGDIYSYYLHIPQTDSWEQFVKQISANESEFKRCVWV